MATLDNANARSEAPVLQTHKIAEEPRGSGAELSDRPGLPGYLSSDPLSPCGRGVRGEGCRAPGATGGCPPVSRAPFDGLWCELVEHWWAATSAIAALAAAAGSHQCHTSPPACLFYSMCAGGPDSVGPWPASAGRLLRPINQTRSPRRNDYGRMSPELSPELRVSPLLAGGL
jgi:hypothetical protein